MQEKWVVKNNSKMIISMPKMGIVLRPKGTVDLVSATGMEVKDLERDSELSVQFTHEHFETIEKIKNPEKGEIDPKIQEKLDAILSKVENMPQNQREVIVEKQSVEFDPKNLENILRNIVSNIGAGEKTASKEEDEMREEAIKKLVENAKAPKVSELDNFGKQKKNIDHDDNSDLISF